MSYNIHNAKTSIPLFLHFRGFVQLKAESTSSAEVSDWPEPLKDKILLEEIFPNETDADINWMAEPLTDAATRESNKVEKI